MSLPTPERPRVPTITIGLRPHSSTAPATSVDHTPPVGMLLATMYAPPEGGAVFEFKLEDSRLGALRIPPATAPGAADELWKHTCFEAFVGVQGEPGYREFNFSPSGQWAIYDFSAPRERDTGWHTEAEPQLRFEQDGDAAWLEARVPAAALPAVPPGTDLEIGLAAVIERSDGELEYWAVSHPAPQPDFHARNGFVLTLKTWAADVDGKR
ncbi:DOMON-like domain-containing protein [Thauera sp.]|uniref:DOMON-like domain-containing protein n=1 Tax=Thauera sp. TaxID=1905334 RepID=UPI0039E42E94